MKKLFFIFVLLSFNYISVLQAENKPVVLHPATTNGHGSDNRPKPRTPIAIPDVYLDEYTLTFDASCIGCTITLVDEDENTVYTTMIDETCIVELPNNLTGTFELQLVRGSITFVGTIEL